MLLVSFISVLFVAGGNAFAASHTCAYHYSQTQIRLNGHRVMIESYIPDGTAHYPLVFMLHGSAGAFTVKPGVEPTRDNFGEKEIARSCFVVVLPHYLEAFGYKSLASRQTIIALFPKLFLVTGELLTRAESVSRVRGEPVFLFGESLGAYLSVALALHRPEVKAVSEISGGIPEGYAVSDPHSLAFLICHGARDNIVPVTEAYELNRYCKRHGLEAEMNLYDRIGHYFPAPVEANCISSTIRFFLRNTPG